MLKDDKLSFIYNAGNNIARFISVSPENKIRHVWIDENYTSSNDLKENIINLINLSSSKSVNIRSFSEESVKGNRFVYGKKLEDIDEIMQIINENCKEGKYSIINETIDINDGGVSGVIMGNIIEFSPNDTPRCVEKEGVCRLPLNVGLAILKTVYGFMPRHTFRPNHRIEFSIHPQMEGIMNWHTVIWEYEEIEETSFANFIIESASSILIVSASLITSSVFLSFSRCSLISIIVLSSSFVYCDVFSFFAFPNIFSSSFIFIKSFQFLFTNYNILFNISQENI